MVRRAGPAAEEDEDIDTDEPSPSSNRITARRPAKPKKKKNRDNTAPTRRRMKKNAYDIRRTQSTCQ